MDTADMAVKMTGGQALVQALYREGVRVIFGVPGMQQYHAVDAVYRGAANSLYLDAPRASHDLHGRRLCSRQRPDRHGDGRAGAGAAQRRGRAWPPPMRSPRPCWS